MTRTATWLFGWAPILGPVPLTELWQMGSSVPVLLRWMCWLLPGLKGPLMTP